MSSQVGVAGRHMIKVHDDVSDNSSIDSLLSPSSPVNNKQWTNKKNKSLINYINREAGHSQDSGVLVELCGHI
uniref:Uncharacterized protein n=2 Tax=Amphimedon queenslandica TaxID=400682 RepID=A0A1X7TX73_AMPQE